MWSHSENDLWVLPSSELRHATRKHSRALSAQRQALFNGSKWETQPWQPRTPKTEEYRLCLDKMLTDCTCWTHEKLASRVFVFVVVCVAALHSMECMGLVLSLSAFFLRWYAPHVRYWPVFNFLGIENMLLPTIKRHLAALSAPAALSLFCVIAATVVLYWRFIHLLDRLDWTLANFRPAPLALCFYVTVPVIMASSVLPTVCLSTILLTALFLSPLADATRWFHRLAGDAY
eukprot:TRINITY_DN33738_c0_g1_i1.p1 TRINITY_DN33738_c0_g1~~TRINITY_DN33738_c0_g1_i1.p1  ORF type:complete len:232 (-),score=6.33 TRINITY_DN33738_c0_g1_i1:123-818(-)